MRAFIDRAVGWGQRGAVVVTAGSRFDAHDGSQTTVG